MKQSLDEDRVAIAKLSASGAAMENARDAPKSSAALPSRCGPRGQRAGRGHGGRICSRRPQPATAITQQKG
jgi:hypothetical protein